MSDEATRLSDSLIEEYQRLLAEGWEPDVDEFLRRVPEKHRDRCRGRIVELTEDRISVQIVPDRAEEEDVQDLDPVAASQEAQLFVAEFRRIRDDGYEPDLEEYLGRLPEEIRDEVRQGIEAAPARATVVRTAHDELFAPAVPPPDADPDDEPSAELDDEEPVDELAALEPEREPEPDSEPVSRLLYPDPPEPHDPPAAYDAPVGEPSPEPALDEIAPVVEQQPELEPEAPAELAPEPAAALPETGGAPTVAGYRLGEPIGADEIGDVFSAFDDETGAEVAVKLLRPEALGRARARITHEVGRAVGFEHRAVVPVLAVEQVDGAPAIVMEKVDGVPLDQAAESLGVKQQANLLLEIAAGLAAAHDAGLLHGNLRPANVIVTPGMQPRIADFGQGMSLREAPDGVDLQAHFLSPEQTSAMRLGPASDIYSLGAVMYAVLTGQPPFDGADAAEIAHRIATEDPPFPRSVAPGVPQDLQDICLACLARNPKRRPAAAAVAAELSRFLAGEPARLKPALYRDVVENGVQKHRDAVAAWSEQGIIPSRDRDRLDAVYRRISTPEGAADRLSVAQTLLYASTWAAVLGTALLAWLGGVPAPFGPGLAALAVAALAGAGVVARLKDDDAVAAALLAGAVAALVPATLVCLAHAGVLATGAVAGAGITWLQAAAALGAGLGGAALGWLWLRQRLFAWLAAGLVAAGWMGFVAWWGVAASPAAFALWSLSLAALALPGLLCERRGRADFGQPFFLVALAALVAAPLVLASGGAMFELFGIDHVVRAPRDAYVGFTLHGLLLLAFMLVLERMESLDLRRAARLFESVVPVLLVGSLYGSALANGAGADIVLHFAACALLLGLAPWRNRRAFLAGGLVGVALGMHLLLHQELAGPAPLAIGLVLAGLVVALGSYVRLRRAR